MRSDEDRALHDHPWPFLVIPIWRGYIEHSVEGFKWQGYNSDDTFTAIPIKIQRRVYPILGSHFRPSTFRHRVELLRREISEESKVAIESYTKKKVNINLPAWSIFVRFRREREWGFYMPDGWISHEQFEKEHCE